MKISKIKAKILFKIYGFEYAEAFRLDSILMVLSDENLHNLDNVSKCPKELERIIDKLVNDGYIKRDCEYYKITSDGLLFYAKGGYTNQYLSVKRANCSFWISIISAIIAVVSFFISISC